MTVKFYKSGTLHNPRCDLINYGCGCDASSPMNPPKETMLGAHNAIANFDKRCFRSNESLPGDVTTARQYCVAIETIFS